MKILEIHKIQELFKTNKETQLFGKWVTFKDIENLYHKHNSIFKIAKVGSSEGNIPIYSLKIGNGATKILLWSQMHGNESTGTKALFDLFNLFHDTSSSNEIINTIKSKCTLLFVPMLNPDGAEAYTRENRNGVDLNRDAVLKSAKESKILRKILKEFYPKFCFNLHDQRTIFGVEGTQNAATVSFLAPSTEKTRALTEGRKETMNVIIAMNSLLQQIIPNHIGRYTDEFYPTATGDNFQKLGFNTILIESGHFPKDYVREKSREFTFYAILQGIFHIATTSNFSEYKDYFSIPNNVKSFYDVIHRFKDGKEAVAFQYKDQIIDNKLVLKLEKVVEKSLIDKFGHNEIVFESQNI